MQPRAIKNLWICARTGKSPGPDFHSRSSNTPCRNIRNHLNNNIRLHRIWNGNDLLQTMAMVASPGRLHICKSMTQGMMIRSSLLLKKYWQSGISRRASTVRRRLSIRPSSSILWQPRDLSAHLYSKP